MRYQRIIPLFILFSFVLSFVVATSANAYNLNTPSCQTPSPTNSSITAKIENISPDKSSFQAVCLQDGKPIYTNIVAKDPELKSILMGFGRGDHIALEYKQENGQNILQNLSVVTKNLDWWWTLPAFIISMFLLWLIGKIILTWGGERKGWLDLITGLDNRYSNSKTQITLWFFILISSYIAANGLRTIHGGSLDFAGGVAIPQNLLILSGLSAFTFVTAKGITQGKEDKAKEEGFIEPRKLPNLGKPKFANLFQNDEGDVDLGDFQMIIVTGLAVVVYSTQLISFLSTIELRHTVSLPDVDTTILSIFGIGQGSYLVKKFLGDSGIGFMEKAKIANKKAEIAETAETEAEKAKTEAEKAETEAEKAEKNKEARIATNIADKKDEIAQEARKEAQHADTIAKKADRII